MDPSLANQQGESDEPELSQQQAEELDRRVAAHRRSPENVISWQSIKDEINRRYQ